MTKELERVQICLIHILKREVLPNFSRLGKVLSHHPTHCGECLPALSEQKGW